jgi:hypothetical protein
MNSDVTNEQGHFTVEAEARIVFAYEAEDAGQGKCLQALGLGWLLGLLRTTHERLSGAHASLRMTCVEVRMTFLKK